MERKCRRHDALIAQMRELVLMEDYYASCGQTGVAESAAD
jgi:hypothetical protein